MSSTEDIYLICLSALLLLFILYGVRKTALLSIGRHRLSTGSKNLYYLFLRYFSYPRPTWRLFGLSDLSPLRVGLLILYFLGTVVCNFIGTQTASDRRTRAAHISLINLLPLYLSGGPNVSARLLGISLEAYGIIHRTAAFMAVLQAGIHVGIALRETGLDLSKSLNLYGLLASSMFLSLLLLPLVKRRVYEIFLVTHLALSILGLFYTWQHTESSHTLSRRYLLLCIASFTVTEAFQLLRIIYRNIVFGKSFVRCIMKPYAENNVQVSLHLPRPWKVRAGERISLGIPYLGLFYLFQSHPFSIAWWENNAEGEAVTIHLLFRARTGFTRKVLECLEADREYLAWIDGPFGPSPVHHYRPLTEVSDYEQILMVTTGIGIAAQLPYIKEVLLRHHGAMSQKITLVWQVDRTGDWESIYGWLQQLVKQDTGYILNVAVYDPSDSIKGPRQVGEHELIFFHGGNVDWNQVLLREMEEQKGRLLVTVSARRRVRNTMRRLVRQNVQFDIELFELEFQPWSEGRDWFSFFTP